MARKERMGRDKMEPLGIENPFREILGVPKTAREKLTNLELFCFLIDIITYLHNYMKEKHFSPDRDLPYIESDMLDYEVAWSIAKKGLLLETDIPTVEEIQKVYRIFRKR